MKASFSDQSTTEAALPGDRIDEEVLDPRPTPTFAQRAAAGNLKYFIWILSGFAFLGAWVLIRDIIGLGNLVLPSPQGTWDSFWRHATDGTLLGDLWITGLEVVIGLAMGVSVGVVVGLFIGYFPFVNLTLRPWVSAGYSTPLIALTPLFIVWLGLGIWSKVIIVFIVALFPVLVNTALGVSSADQRLIEMVRALGGAQRQVITKVVLRGAVPHITTGIRLAVGRALTAVVAAELLGSTGGMGHRILRSSQIFDTATTIAYVIVLAIIGATVMTLLEIIDKKASMRRTG